MHPSRPTSRRPSEPSPWERIAARASHPASGSGGRTEPQIGEESWLWSIVAGLARASAPWPGALGAQDEIAVSRLLDTHAYRAWIVGWPPGSCRAVDASLHVHSFCVVDGTLDLIDDPAAATIRRSYGSGHGGVLTTPTGRFRNGSGSTTSVHVVLFGPEAAAPDLPWSSCVGAAR